MNKSEMKEQREANYKKWFDRWMEIHGLNKQITISNNKNYTQLELQVHRVDDERDKKMMKDEKFVQLLGNEFPDFKISREKEKRDRYLLGARCGQIEIDRVIIDWR